MEPSNKELKSLMGTAALNSAILVSYFLTTTLTSYASGSNVFAAIGVLATGFTIRDAYKMFHSWRSL